MRGFIKFCSWVFIALGILTMAAGVYMAVNVIQSASAAASQQAQQGANAFAALGAGIGLMVAASGFISGAGITLIGGATYLLASIDERLEKAGKRTAPAHFGLDNAEPSLAHTA